MPASAGEALQAARTRLAAHSHNPGRDAEVLLTHVSGWDRAALLTHPERLLSAEQWTQLESLVTRRAACEPMQYITGAQEFFGLLFEVSPDVLIPRPETEHVVEAALKRFDRFGREATLRIVDVGTGSGAIAVALAHALPQSDVMAVDLSLAALEVARRNAKRHGVLDRLTLLQSDSAGGDRRRGFRPCCFESSLHCGRRSVGAASVSIRTARRALRRTYRAGSL